MLEILGTIVAALAAADLVVGLVHWAEDTYCGRLPAWLRGTPLEAAVCDPNQNHHERPLAMGGSFVSRNGLQLAVAAIVIAIDAACGLVGWPLWLTAALAGLANEVHYWSHSRPPRWGRLLQAMHVLQTPQQHARHHRGQHDDHYCTLTNWINPLLDGCGFWRRLEHLVERTCGWPPERVLPTAAAARSDDLASGGDPAHVAADRPRRVLAALVGRGGEQRCRRIRHAFGARLQLKRQELERIEAVASAAIAAAIDAGESDPTHLEVIGSVAVRRDAECGVIAGWLAWQLLGAVIGWLVRYWLDRRFGDDRDTNDTTEESAT